MTYRKDRETNLNPRIGWLTTFDHTGWLMGLPHGLAGGPELNYSQSLLCVSGGTALLRQGINAEASFEKALSSPFPATAVTT